jgi:hypothetical protein
MKNRIPEMSSFPQSPAFSGFDLVRQKDCRSLDTTGQPDPEMSFPVMNRAGTKKVHNGYEKIIADP